MMCQVVENRLPVRPIGRDGASVVRNMRLRR